MDMDTHGYHISVRVDTIFSSKWIRYLQRIHTSRHDGRIRRKKRWIWIPYCCPGGYNTVQVDIVQSTDTLPSTDICLPVRQVLSGVIRHLERPEKKKASQRRVREKKRKKEQRSNEPANPRPDGSNLRTYEPTSQPIRQGITNHRQVENN